jgi:hypothetical protein
MEVVVKRVLGYSRWALVVRKRGGARRVPLHQVDRVWILTGGVAISSRLVRALSRNLIDVVFFDGKGEPVARLFPPDSNGVAAHRRAQYEAYFNERGFELARGLRQSCEPSQGPQTRRPVEAGAVRGARKGRRRGGWAGGGGVEMRRRSVRVGLRGGGRLGLLGGALLRLRRAGEEPRGVGPPSSA